MEKLKLKQSESQQEELIVPQIQVLIWNHANSLNSRWFFLHFSDLRKQSEIAVNAQKQNENELPNVVDYTEIVGMRWIDKHGNQWIIDSEGIPKPQNIENVAKTEHDLSLPRLDGVIGNHNDPPESQTTCHNHIERYYGV